MKKHVLLLTSLILLTPTLAHADYNNPAKSGVERLPHFAQQHYTPHAKVVMPVLPVETEVPPTEETSFTYVPPKQEDVQKPPSKTDEAESTVAQETPVSTSVKPNTEVVQVPQINTDQSQAPVNTEGYVEVPYSSQDGVIRIETNTVQETPTIYGYSEDGLPITDFSNKVNHYKAQFIEQNPHLFKAKKPL